MPSFTYRGSSRTLVLAGRRLDRGVPTELTGRAADAAAAHPDIDKGKPKKAAVDTPAVPATALTEIAAYLESGTADAGELTTKLVALDETTLAELAAEYDIQGEIAGTVLNDLAVAMLADGSTPEPEKLTGEALDDRIAELEIDASSGGSNADGTMSADEKRAAIAAAEAAGGGAG